MTTTDPEKEMTQALWELLADKRLPFDIIDKQTSEIMIPAYRKITKRLCQRVAQSREHLWLEMYKKSQ